MTSAYPGGSRAPLIPSADSRKCSNCSSPLGSLGVRAVPTLEYSGHPPGAFVLETYHCPHCGKIEFFTPR